MLTCRARGLFSWTYVIQRNDQPVAELEFRLPSRQCEIRFEGESFHVVFDRIKSELELLDGDEWLGTARDVSLARTNYQLRTEHHTLELVQSSLLSSKYELSEDGHSVGTIARVHAGSSDASVDVQDQVPLLLQLFVFAVVALVWHGVEPSPRST
jgi:hypothetical protein